MWPWAKSKKNVASAGGTRVDSKAATNPPLIELIPPQWMIDEVGGGDFHQVGNAFLGHFKAFCNLSPNSMVLDVGSGCGRIALPLTGYITTGNYEGFDIEKPLVDWCQANITSKHPNFRFQHADIYNGRYNPHGKIQSFEFQFPYQDDYFDIVNLSSVFTHMLPADIEHYFSEVYRVLKTGGVLSATYFIVDAESQELISAGKSSLNFQRETDDYWVHDKNILEAAVGYSIGFIENIYKNYNMKYHIFPGNWNGKKNENGYQDMIIAKKS